MRRPLPNIAFGSAAFWRERLKAGPLREALAELGQVMRWLDPELAQEVQRLVQQHPAQKHSELATAWVEGTYLALGHGAHPTLVEHAQGRRGSPSSRALAQARAQELSFEAGWHQALTRAPAPAQSGLQLGERFTLPAPRLSAGAATRWITSWEPHAHHELLLAHGVAPALVADCDGTLWRGDIGEQLYLRAVKERWFLPVAAQGVAAMLTRYGLAATGDPNRDAEALGRSFDEGDLVKRGRDRGIDRHTVTRDFYAVGAWGFAGHPVARIKGWATELFEAGRFHAQVFAGARHVLTAAAQRGVLSYACSASNQWIVEVGVQYLGIPSWRVRGIQVHLEEGLLGLNVREPLTYGPGKVLAARDMTGGRPLIGMGDSVDGTDRELLEASVIRWGIGLTPARRKFVVERAQDNWGELDLEARS